MTRNRWTRGFSAFFLAAAVATAGSARGATVDLVAMQFVKTMPDGAMVTMWGFALDGASPAPTVPGPALSLLPTDTTLTINLRNELDVPVSIVIPGQTTSGAFSPAAFTDGQGRSRISSFTTETAPHTTGGYSWTGVRPGTYVYHSGTHAAVQVQMGLYGALRKDAATGEAYAGKAYDDELLLIYSEVDPTLHLAVASDKYGPGKPVSSTLHYKPAYVLLNGDPYVPGTPALTANGTPRTVLIRFVNASLRTRVPAVLGSTMRLIAEDGNLYPYERDQYTALLPAGKTVDALWTAPAAGVYPLFDRALVAAGAGSGCGDGIVDQATEQCDGRDDTACPGLCRSNCTCAPPTTTTTSTTSTSMSTSTTSTSTTSSTTTSTTLPTPTTLEVRVAANSDDAEERNSNGAVNLTSSDLELDYDGFSQTVGIRFRGVTVPRGALIVRAWVQFRADVTTTTPMTLRVQGEASDNAAIFTTATRNVSSRGRTAASVASWSPASWTSGNVGVDQRTPDLQAVIQEIVNRPLWASGNALAVIVTRAATETRNNKRVATSYDKSQTGAPLLHVEYQPAPTVTTTSTTTSTTTTSTTIGGPTSTTTTVPTTTTLPSTPPVASILADVAVDSSVPGSNLGTQNQLHVDAGPTIKRTFIRVQVSNVGGRTVTSALLNLRVPTVTNAQSVTGGQIHLMTDCAWVETTTNYGNQPPVGGAAFQTMGAVTQGQLVSFNVISKVPGDGTYCFGIDSASTDGVDYHSREASTASDRPQLVVQVAP